MKESVIEFLMQKKYGFWFEPIRQAYLTAWLHRDQDEFKSLIHEADGFSFAYVSHVEEPIHTKVEDYSQYLFALMYAYLDIKEEEE